MDVPSPVDYAEIRDDFAFFLAHSTETEAQVAALRPHLARLARLARRRQAVRMLDFGCGDGRFAARLLRAAGLPGARLALVLVEPVAALRAEAARRLAPLARAVADAGGESGEESGVAAGPAFDLILANHSLYYVAEPAATVRALARRLAPGGRLIAALLDSDNALARIWRAGFAAAGLAFPYPLAEDLEAVLRGAGLAPAREEIGYRIAFPDRAEARRRILRFLLGANLERLAEARADALFAPYRRGGRVIIDTAYPHLVVRQTTSTNGARP
jgi:SAM-dependent methyltransferase